MLVRKKIFFITVLLFISYALFSLDYKSCNNPFNVSCLKFSNESVNVIEQNIKCNETDIENEFILYNISENNALLQITIECKALGFGRNGNDIVIPYDFSIYYEGSPLKFEVYKNDILINENAWYKTFCLLDDKIEIKFEVSISKNSKRNISISYRNLQSGVSQVNMKYWYHISLYKNQNNNPVNISFIYKSSENSELYISDINIENNKNNLEIVRNFDKNTMWYTNIKDYISEKDDSYLDISFLYYNLGCIDSPIYIGQNNIEPTIYWNYTKDLKSIILSKKDLFFFGKEQLSQLRNSFYAIHGYIFKNNKWTELYKRIFDDIGLEYNQNNNFNESEFSEIERKSIELIKEMENIIEPIKYSDYLK